MSAIAIHPATPCRFCALRQVHRGVQAHSVGHRPRRDSPARSSTSRRSSCLTGCRSSTGWPSSARTNAACCRRSRDARTPTSSVWSSVTSAPKILEVSRDHWLGDQTALEALVRFTDEELKHQELFRRIETHVAQRACRQGIRSCREPNAVASVVLSEVHLGSARTDLPYRVVHAGALSRAASSRTAMLSALLQGRVPVTTRKRNRSTRSSTSWNGCARTRSSRPRRAMRP